MAQPNAPQHQPNTQNQNQQQQHQHQPEQHPGCQISFYDPSFRASLRSDLTQLWTASTQFPMLPRTKEERDVVTSRATIQSPFAAVTNHTAGSFLDRTRKGEICLNDRYLESRLFLKSPIFPCVIARNGDCYPLYEKLGVLSCTRLDAYTLDGDELIVTSRGGKTGFDHREVLTQTVANPALDVSKTLFEFSKSTTPNSLETVTLSDIMEFLLKQDHSLLNQYMHTTSDGHPKFIDWLSFLVRCWGVRSSDHQFVMDWVLKSCGSQIARDKDLTIEDILNSINHSHDHLLRQTNLSDANAVVSSMKFEIHLLKAKHQDFQEYQKGKRSIIAETWAPYEEVTNFVECQFDVFEQAQRKQREHELRRERLKQRIKKNHERKASWGGITDESDDGMALADTGSKRHNKRRRSVQLVARKQYTRGFVDDDDDDDDDYRERRSGNSGNGVVVRSVLGGKKHKFTGAGSNRVDSGPRRRLRRRDYPEDDEVSRYDREYDEYYRATKDYDTDDL